jgi:hypothetical protein
MEQNINLVSQTTEQSQQQQQSKEDWEIEFERLEPHIISALKHQDRYNLSDIKEKIGQGVFHIWPGKDAFYISSFGEFPKYRILNLFLCGGNYEELEEMLKSIEQFAKQWECKYLYGGGRKGWLRKIKHLGFEQEYIVKKEL